MIAERFKKAWFGQERLWVVFWIYNVIGGFIFVFLLAAFVMLTGIGMGIFSSPGAMEDSAPPVAFVYAIYIPWVLYFGWVSICSWRCALNTDFVFLGYIIRFFVILFFIQVVAGFYQIGNMKDMTPEDKAKLVPHNWHSCTEAVEYYAKINKESVAQYNTEHPNAVQDMIDLGKCPDTPAPGTK